MNFLRARLDDERNHTATLERNPSAPDRDAQHDLERSATIDYRSELIRKAIHLNSLSIPIIYYFISRELALAILVPLTVVFIFVDLARYYHPEVSEWFYRWFGWLLRRHEQDNSRKRLNGATNVLIGATLSILLFPKPIVVTALAILIISDSTSALVGRRFARKRFLNKSVAGALAFFTTAALVVALAPKIQGLPMEYAIGLVGCGVGTIVESLSTRIDDNITVPLSISATMWALYALLLPGVLPA